MTRRVRLGVGAVTRRVRLGVGFDTPAPHRLPPRPWLSGQGVHLGSVRSESGLSG